MERGLAVIQHHSCISLSITRSDEPPKSNWIFFSSPSGFELFLHQFGLPQHTLLAALGAGTASKMSEFGLKPDFAPTSSDPRKAIEEFVAFLAPGANVLIARSEISLQRFQGLLAANQLIDWPFYSNEPNPPDAPTEAGFLIFTSPSNARAYFSKHSIAAYQKVVAIGHSTLAALEELGFRGVLVAKSPTESEMWAEINKAEDIE